MTDPNSSPPTPSLFMRILRSPGIRLIVSLFEILTEEQRAQALVLIEEMPDDFQRRGQGRRSGPPSGE